MSLRIVGAGLPRTGTTSLKYALEQLLGAPCYHMRELAGHVDHAPLWRDAFEGGPPDWDTLLAGYAAGVDWPVSWFWRELSEYYPDAIVLLSRRESPERWYQSMDRTVLNAARRLSGGDAGMQPPWHATASPAEREASEAMSRIMFGLFDRPDDPDAVIAVYERHLAEVRATIPADRLLDWQPGDGWQPLCDALGLPVPDVPFPHENTTADMRARMTARNML